MNINLAKNKKLFSSKGFIGPIGDDLPSLIPIVIALLLFFSIFEMTLSSYTSKNDFIQKETNMTSVAREIKGDSLILGIDQFSSRCEAQQVKKYSYSFMAGIYPTDVDLSKVIDDFATASSQGAVWAASDDSQLLKQTLDSGEKKAYFCNYSAIGGKEFSKDKKNYLVRFYPIAVQYPVVSNGGTQYMIVPALMAMVFWQ